MKHRRVFKKALRKYFPDRELRKKALKILSRYSSKTGYRVKSAILKVAENDFYELERCTTVACKDFRDVVSWAEYPSQFNARPGNGSPELVQKDLEQYQAWIDSL